MKKHLYAVTLVLALLTTGEDAFLACGDKFLVPSRGSRSQRPGLPRQPATILIYDSASALRAGFKHGSAYDTLSKAGFRPTAAASRSDFDRELSRGRWDAVLVSLEDAAVVSERVRASAQPAVVVPVALNATDAVVKQTRKEFPVVLRLPAKDDAFLSAIDRALEHKPKR